MISLIKSLFPLWVIASSASCAIASSGSQHERVLLQARQQTDLRILPLGDSITYGWWSTTLNGYRNDLLQMLQFHDKYQVQYIGFQHSGSMDNNVHEGFPGATIDQIHANGFEAFNTSLPLPNVILLHAGTNDAINAFQNVDPATVDVEKTAEQMANDLNDLVGDIFKQAPDVCLIVSQIMMSADPNVQRIIDTFNGYVPFVIDNYRDKNIVGVSMSNINLNGGDHDSVYPDDPIHPGNDGFAKMASNFFEGILAADAAGKIPGVQGNFSPAPHASLGAIANNPGNAWAYQCDLNATWSAKQASFGGVSSVAGGTYRQNWKTAGGFSNNQAGQALNGGFVWFADFNNDGLADYVYVDPERGSLRGWRNLGGGNWKDLGQMATGLDSTDGAGIIIVDVNGDGYADYLWQNSAGDTIYLWYNYYGNGWVQENVTASGFPGTRENTHMADINGDGRADLVWLDSNGNVNAWMNTGIGTDITWVHAGIVGTNVGSGGVSALFSDVDADGRADYVYVNSDGSMDVWLNPDLTGLGNVPAFTAGGSFAPASGISIPNIHLADMDGDGRADYVVVDPKSGELTVSLNKGSDAFGQIRFADANNDGRADIFLVGNSGNVRAWQNDGGTSFPSKDSVYQDSEQLGPKYIRLADVNGDGKTDIITINPLTCDLNAYTGNGDFTFNTNPVTIWTGGKPQGCQDCSSIYFTDNNADGRSDLICLTSDATAWLTFNNPTGDFNSLTNINWTYFGWILINQGVTRNQARFVDLNGDGQDDVMTVNAKGTVHAFVSNTLAAVFGGRDEFIGDGTPYTQIMLADMNGDSRADYLQVSPTTGAVSAFLNECADEAYPRKPGEPRPSSPGTSLSPRAKAGPTFTSSHISSSPSTTPRPSPTRVSTFSGGSPIPTWAAGSWTNIPCTSLGATTVTAGQLGGRPTDLANGAELWRKSGAQDALHEMFSSYQTHFNSQGSQHDELADFEKFVKSSWMSPRANGTCTNAKDADCINIEYCQDVGSPALFYISQSLDTIKSLHYGLYQAFLNKATDVTQRAEDWAGTFVEDSHASDTALKRIEQVIEGFVSVGLSLLTLGTPVGPAIDAALGTGVIQVAINDAIASQISDVGSAFERNHVDFAKTSLELVDLIDGIAHTIADFESQTILNDFQSAGFTIGNGSMWKLQALMSGGGAVGGSTISINEGMFEPHTTHVLWEFAFQSGWYMQNASAYNWPFIFYIDHSVYDCNSRDLTKAGQIPGDPDTVYNILENLAVNNQDPKIDANTAWCDADNNAYFLWNAKFGAAHQTSGPKSYRGPLVGGFPAADIKTLAPGNTAWGNVTMEDIARSTVYQFIRNGFSNDLSKNNLPPPDAFDFTGRPPPGFFPFPVCTSAYALTNNIDFGDLTNKNNDPTWPCGIGGNATDTGFTQNPPDIRYGRYK